MSIFPSHNYSELIGDNRNNVITLTASASAIIDIDLNTVANLQALLDITYTDGTDGTTTGVTAKIYNIFGNPVDSGLPQDPLPYKVGGFTEGVPPAGVLVADNFETIEMATMPTGEGGSVSRKTSFYLNEIGNRWPRGARLRLDNTDPSNPAEVRIYIEM